MKNAEGPCDKDFRESCETSFLDASGVALRRNWHPWRFVCE